MITALFNEKSKINILSASLNTGKNYKHIDYPVKLEEQNVTSDLQIKFYNNLPGTTKLEIFADDCILDFSLNNAKLSEPTFPTCSYPKTIQVNVRGNIKVGVNVLNLRLQNYGGSAELIVSNSKYNLNSLLIKAINFLTVLVLCLQVFNYIKGFSTFSYLRPYLILALFLRHVYFFGTDANLRTYDLLGHLQYIKYVISNFSIPNYDFGWQTYQAPNYYFVSVFWVKAANFFAFNDLEGILQGWSLLISILTYFCMMCIAIILFNDQLKQKVFCLICSCFPGIIMLTSRITNDTLLTLLVILTTAFVLIWVAQKRLSTWILIILIANLALLTKTNGIIVLVLIIATPWLIKGIVFIKKLQLSLLVVVLSIFLSGWYLQQRFIIEKQTHLVGNIASTDNELYSEGNSLATFITFNPYQLIKNPFVDSRDDLTRRVNFWEYYVRSALFGEFNFSKQLKLHSRILLSLLVILIIISIGNIVNGMKKENPEYFFIMLFFLFISLSFHSMLRITTPIPALADFRYTAFVLIPFAYFLVINLKNNLYSNLVKFLIFIFCYSSALWICIISLK